MLRRHSVCLSDIPSFADPLEQNPLGESYTQTSKYENPAEDTTIWTIRKSPTPMMTATMESASATPVKPATNTNTTTAEDNEHEKQPQDNSQATSAKKKKKNKKKKPKSRSKAKDKLELELELEQTEGSTVETETESLSQLVQPMQLGTPTPFIVNSASWHKVGEVCSLLALQLG